MADPNQTPSRGEWACPCNGCQKAVAYERKQLIKLLEDYKKEYLIYRGSAIDNDGNLIWAKDDAWAYAEGVEKSIEFIKDRMPKPKEKK
jgi:hypothetical protein